MIYTVAAYTITFGTLGLYWVLLAHRRSEHAEALARATGGAMEDPRQGFNVGALLLAPLWMLGHGMLLPGILVLVPTLAIVPLVTQELWTPLFFVASIPVAAGAALGFVGNRIAVSHSGVETPGAFSASQLPWHLAGIALFTIVLPWVLYFAV